MNAERPICGPISEMQLVPDPVRSLLNLVPPSLPKLANVSRVVLAYTPQPTLPLTEGSHNSQCCRNIILSFSSSLPFSPLRVYSAIVSRTGDQSANSRRSRSHMNNARPAAARGRTEADDGYLFQTTIAREKMGGQTEGSMDQARH